MKRFRIAAIGIAAVTACSLLATPTAPAQARTLPRSVAVPVSAVNVVPLAVSGPHILVQVGGGTFRLSYDAGKTWKPAKGYCHDRSSVGCADWSGSEASEPVGRVLNGVVAHVQTISSDVREVSAYSLRTGSVVGTPYRWTDDQRVGDMLGGQAVFWNAGVLTVRSVIDRSTWTIPQSDRYNAFHLLADGSVIVQERGDGLRPWQRITRDGSVSALVPASGQAAVVGSTVAYRPAPGQLCVVSPTAPTPSCRSGLATGADTIAQLSPFGILTAGTKPLWLPISHAHLGAPVRVKLTAPKYPTAETFQPALSLENAYPIIARKTSSGSRLLQVQPNGKVTARRLAWARTWGHDDVIGEIVLTSKKVFLSADTLASGIRSAVLRNGRLSIRDNGKTTGRVSIGSSPSTGLQSISGPQVLVSADCGSGEGPVNDDPCPGDVYRSDGTKLATIAAADIFGDLALVPDGSRGAVRIVRYRGTQSTVASFTLPEPGEYGYYQDLHLLGDWVAGTFTDKGSDWRAFAYNYRTGTLKLAPSSASRTTLQALGDGYAVITAVDAASHTQLQIWKLADGSTTSLSSVSWKVTADGSRFAYLKGDPVNYLAPARIVTVDLSSLSMTHPRVLGAAAPATWKKGWKLAIDVTKAVRAGRLEIRDAGGNLVRALKVGASHDGSLRNLRWDGRDNRGTSVPAGTYSYRLISSAIDGSGAVQAADGSTGPLGTVVVR